MEAQIEKLQSQLEEVQQKIKAEQEADEEAGEDTPEDEGDVEGDEVCTVSIHQLIPGLRGASPDVTVLFSKSKIQQ